VEDARDLRRSVEEQAKPKQARMRSMGPLLEHFPK